MRQHRNNLFDKLLGVLCFTNIFDVLGDFLIALHRLVETLQSNDKLIETTINKRGKLEHQRRFLTTRAPHSTDYRAYPPFREHFVKISLTVQELSC